jgi:hypothetical protein
MANEHRPPQQERLPIKLIMPKQGPPIRIRRTPHWSFDACHDLNDLLETMRGRVLFVRVEASEHPDQAGHTVLAS